MCIAGEWLHVWCRKDAGSSKKLEALFRHTVCTEENSHCMHVSHYSVGVIQIRMTL
jgi:hypothetical protein